MKIQNNRKCLSCFQGEGKWARWVLTAPPNPPWHALQRESALARFCWKHK